MEDSVIYEAHVRGFPIADVERSSPGTFTGLVERFLT
jgi:pullulanase/glycogen debranching enzyme